MAGPSRYLHIHEFRVFGLLWRIKNAPHSISEIRCKGTAFQIKHREKSCTFLRDE